MAVFFRRRGVKTKKSGIDLVEYIESSGTQFFDTGYIPNNNTRVVMDCEVLTFETAVYFGVCTVASGSTGNAQTYDTFILNGTSTRTSHFGSTVTANGVAKGRVIVDRNKNVAKFGDSITITNSAMTGSSAFNLYLLARNIGGSSADWQIDMRLYSCQIYDGETLVRDYMPCYDPDGVACLYDMVNGEYVYNAGTGEFVAGERLAPQEPSINFIDYLESTGTQYIKTGVAPKSTTRVVMDFKFTKSTSVWQGAFGARSSSTGSDRFCFWQSNSSYFRSDYYNNNQQFATTVKVLERHVVDKNRNVTTIDGTTTMSSPEATFSCPYELYLFCGNNGATAIAEWGSLQIFSCQIYDEDVLVRDYWPCYDEEGVACLYDKVNCEYVYNAGTGEFVGGVAA